MMGRKGLKKGGGRVSMTISRGDIVSSGGPGMDRGAKVRANSSPGRREGGVWRRVSKLNTTSLGPKLSRFV